MLTIILGPDGLGEPRSIVCVSAFTPEDILLSDGWWGTGPRKKTDPDAWLALLKRRYPLRRLRRLTARPSLRWQDAKVTPDGYSEGPGHAPQGIRVTFET